MQADWLAKLIPMSPNSTFHQVIPSLGLSFLIYTTSVLQSLNVYWVLSSGQSSRVQLWTRRGMAWASPRLCLSGGDPVQSSVQCGCWNKTPWAPIPGLPLKLQLQTLSPLGLWISTFSCHSLTPLCRSFLMICTSQCSCCRGSISWPLSISNYLCPVGYLQQSYDHKYPFI